MNQEERLKVLVGLTIFLFFDMYMVLTLFVGVFMHFDSIEYLLGAFFYGLIFLSLSIWAVLILVELEKSYKKNENTN